MRIYIIGNDGITLCREAPATINDGEVAVASKEELHAAPLSGKRLLALWNALPADVLEGVGEPVANVFRGQCPRCRRHPVRPVPPNVPQH